jgi:hypothetical protein
VSSASSAIGHLEIANANVTASTTTAGAYVGTDIGTGYQANYGNSTIGDLSLSGDITLVCDSLRGSRILVSTASVYMFAQKTQVFKTTPDLSGTVFVTILYPTTAAVAQESLLDGFPHFPHSPGVRQLEVLPLRSELLSIGVSRSS